MAVVVDREWAALVSYFLRIYCEILTDTARREFFAPEIRELLVLMSLTTFAKQKRSMCRVEFAKIVNPQSFVIHIALVATLVAFESSAFAQNAPNMPPRNPWLTDSVYPTSHFNPAATDSVLFSRTDEFDELLDLGEVPNDLARGMGLHVMLRVPGNSCVSEAFFEEIQKAANECLGNWRHSGGSTLRSCPVRVEAHGSRDTFLL